jgi:hypothetical protein
VSPSLLPAWSRGNVNQWHAHNNGLDGSQWDESTIAVTTTPENGHDFATRIWEGEGYSWSLHSLPEFASVTIASFLVTSAILSNQNFLNSSSLSPSLAIRTFPSQVIILTIPTAPMATLTLLDLPVEMVDTIIRYTLPEGFESLALTCKNLHALCEPYMRRHNQLTVEFNTFRYSPYAAYHLQTPYLAIQVILRIAAEPIVARYIRYADFSAEDISLNIQETPRPPDVGEGGQLMELFATSRYLAQAGIDWREFYARMIEQVGTRYANYSQHAAAFLLTLLPNVKTLMLPHKWQSQGETDKLVEAIVSEARQTDSVEKGRSLAQVTYFTPRSQEESLDESVPFLTLPNVRTFSLYRHWASGTGHMLRQPGNPSIHCGQNLETVEFFWSHIDDVAMAEFLEHTPRLRTLIYVHETMHEDSGANSDSDGWDICRLIKAIESGVGSHLEDLSLYKSPPDARIAPGKASMRGFKRLRKLRLPLELAMRNIHSSEAQDDGTGSSDEHTLCDFVPATVSELSLGTSGKEEDGTLFRDMFHRIIAIKESRLPNLKIIQICHSRGELDESYRHYGIKALNKEAKKVGMTLILADGGGKRKRSD